MPEEQVDRSDPQRADLTRAGGSLRRWARRPARAAELAPSLSPRLEPTFFSRYECKYTVDPLVLDQIRLFLAPFAGPDRFARDRPGYRYAVCSLYLDSDDLRLYMQTVAGEKNRFKLRVRTYSDDPDSPAYFEIKRKENAVVQKRRAGLSRRQAAALLAGGACEPGWGLPARLQADLDYFTGHAALISARPVMRVKYVREAYEATGNEPARVTIDTGLCHALSLDGDLRHGQGSWVSTPLDGAIVEVKFTERYPGWMQHFVRNFGLRQQAIPKYVLSVDQLLGSRRATALTLAGLTLPPTGA